MAKVEKGLLMYWWHHYGKIIYTFDELNEFEKIIDEYGVEKVLDAAVASCVCGDGSPTVILASIRQDRVKELFESLPDVSKMEEKEKEQHQKMRDEFVKAITPQVS